VAVADEVEAELPALISTNSAADFRAVRQRAHIEGVTATLTRETADALKVRSGDVVRVKT
jgi:arginine N-succinyltransferase